MGSHKGVGPNSRIVILGFAVSGAVADDPALSGPRKIPIVEQVPSTCPADHPPSDPAFLPFATTTDSPTLTVVRIP